MRTSYFKESMKVALVHDYLKEYGGAERVLEALHEIYPEAPVFTAFVDWEGLGIHGKRFKDWEIQESWVGKLPLFKKLHSPLRILAPLIWDSFNFKDFAVVISSSSVYFGKGLNKNGAWHISYCHTPPRFLYGYLTAVEWQKHWWGRIAGNLMNHFLRLYDWQISQKVDYFIANSRETAQRIKKFYRREATVIYPPVELGSRVQGLGSRKKINTKPYTLMPKPYFLCVSRLARAKRIDLAIGACNQLKLSLRVVGAGREEEKLKKMAGPTIQFLGEVADEELASLYAGCQALIFPAEEEDFGLVPVEAMSFGKPVIALRSGGVVESVIEGKTGEFFENPTVESLVQVLQRLKTAKYRPKDCQKQAEKFSKAKFQKEVQKFVRKVWERKKNYY